MATRRRVGQVGRVGHVGRVGQVGLTGRVGLALILVIALGGGTFLRAADPEIVQLMVGRSTVIDVGAPIQRVSLTSSDVADALVTSSAQLLVHGKTPGTISMFVWDRAGAIRRYDVTVQRDLSRLGTQMRELFPVEHVSVEGNGKSIIVSGAVSTKAVADKVVEVAAGYVEGKADVVNLLQVQEGARQVLLQVRFAEVSRSAITDLGASFFTGAAGYKNVLARTTTQQNAAPDFDNKDPNREKLVFSDFLNLFLFDAKHQLGAVIKALQTRGQFQSLAEPNLVAESGKEASFLAGGEIPVPVAQGTSGNVSIAVSYKEFGVRLSFTPVIQGDRVHLKVRPEVSTLDFANGVVLQGFRIPALSTRRTETELELQDGQTFAIAGLLNNQLNSTLKKIPGIGDIPILGLLFQSKAAQKDQTELVVMITPHILSRDSPGVTTALPRTPEPFLAPLPIKKTVEPPPPAFTAPRPAGDGSSSVIPPAPPSGPAPSAAAAAAAVSALTPTTRTLVTAPSATPPAASSAMPSPAAPSVTPSPAPGPTSVKAPDPKALVRARKEEARAMEEQAKRIQAAAKQAAQRAEIQRRKDDQEKKRQAELARAQAKRDAEKAIQASKAAARQAEIDKKRQKALNEAALRLKAAEAQYQAEIAKTAQ